MPKKGKNTAKSGNGKGGKNVSAPAAQSSTSKRGVPSMTSTNGGLRVKHSELVGVVSGAINYSILTYEVNPAIDVTFPWLSGVAENFESYRLYGLSMRYVPRCPTTTNGTIMISCDYNSADPTAVLGPSTEQALMATPGAVETPAWASISFRLDPKRFNLDKYFTRSSGAVSNELYDPAFLYLGVVAFASNDVVGRLFIDYDIELLTPQMPVAEDFGPTATTMFTLANAQNVTVPNSATLLWTPIYNPVGVSYNPGTGAFQLRPGAYKIQTRVRADVVSSVLGGKSKIALLKNGGLLANVPANYFCRDIDSSTDPSTGTLNLINWTEFVGVLVSDLYTDLWSIRYTATGATADTHDVSLAGTVFLVEQA